MSKPTPEQIAKLPLWAQRYVRDLEYQRREAARALKRFTEENDSGAVRCRLMVSDGEQAGPASRDVRFAADWIEIDHANVQLEIILVDGAIRLSYGSQGRIMGPAYLKPVAFQQFTLSDTLGK